MRAPVLLWPRALVLLLGLVPVAYALTRVLLNAPTESPPHGHRGGPMVERTLSARNNQGMESYNRGRDGSNPRKGPPSGP